MLDTPPCSVQLKPSKVTGFYEAQLSLSGEHWGIVEYGANRYYIRSSEQNNVVDTNFTLQNKNESYLLSKVIWRTLIEKLMSRNVVHLHAAVVELEGKAILLLGVSGTGKSTHARLWQEHVPGATLLNDDEAFVKIADHDTVTVYGSPWSGKTACYRNVSASVAAIVHLRQAAHNKLYPLTRAEAMATLILSGMMPHENTTHYPKHMTNVVHLLDKVPMYRLECLPDAEAVALTHQLLLRSNVG